MKAGLPALPTTTPASAGVANPEFSTPTTSQATPTPSVSTPSSVYPNSVTPASQRSHCSSRSQKSLNFEMATRGKSPSHACPVSPGSIFNSSLQESIDTSVKGKRGRGRPRKVPTTSTYDDFPEHGMALEKKWKMCKNAEEWWY